MWLWNVLSILQIKLLSVSTITKTLQTGGQKIVATFARILVSALETNSYNTTHIKFKNIPTSDMTLVIIMIAILPTVAQRTKTPDNLPALYFMGMLKQEKITYSNNTLPIITCPQFILVFLVIISKLTKLAFFLKI